MSAKKTGPKERTIEWWLAKLPPDIAKLALANREKWVIRREINFSDIIECLRDAIFLGFRFYDTPEGEDFWYRVLECNYAEARALLPKPAKKAKVYRAYVASDFVEYDREGWGWYISMGGPTCHSMPYTTKKSAIRGLRRFAATLGIAVEVEVQE
jgi:hypothetical protein